MSLSLIASTLLRIAVIDTGLDLHDPRFQDVLCSSGHKDYTSSSIADTDGHGTHVTGLIKKYAGKESVGKYCLVIYKFYKVEFTGERLMSNMLQAMSEAKQESKIINISAGGPEYDIIEYNIIKHSKDVTYVVAAGNESYNLKKDKYYPASYNLTNMIVVGSMGRNGYRASTSNYGLPGMEWETGEKVWSTFPVGEGVLSGTSQATAIHTGKLIKKMLEKK